MKLIYVANARIPTGKAHGVQIMKMCEAFADTGIEVELWVPTRYNIIKADPFDYFHVKKNFKIVKIYSIDLVRFGYWGFWIQKMTFILFATVRAIFTKANVFYSRDDLFVYLLSIFDRNIYWEAHTNSLGYFISKIIKSRLKFIVISNGLKNFFMSLGVLEDRILVSHDGVSLSDFNTKESKHIIRNELGVPQDMFVVSYVGKYTTMGSKKGVDELIIAFSDILKKYSNLFIQIVGVNKSEVPILENLMNEMGIARTNYNLVPFVAHKDIPKYLNLSNVLIMNYPASEHYSLYMSPLKMFEYMASGRPIVASDLPSIREILNTNNAILVEPDNNQKLINSIEMIFKDDNLADKLSKQALADVKCYTWDKRAEKIIKFINKT